MPADEELESSSLLFEELSVIQDDVMIRPVSSSRLTIFFILFSLIILLHR